MPGLKNVYFFGRRTSEKGICMLETGFEQICDIHKQPHSRDFSALTLPSGLAIKERIGQLQ